MLNCLKEYSLFLDKIVLSDEATFHLSGKVNCHNCQFLSKFTGRWIGHGSCIPWPPRSPNLTPMDFSFGKFVKGNVYIPLMPVDLQEFRDRIVNSIALVDVTFLNKLWYKLEYHLDVCCIIRGSHIEHL
jgi:hypothetical protein